jgi:hypothetical protein
MRGLDVFETEQPLNPLNCGFGWCSCGGLRLRLFSLTHLSYAIHPPIIIDFRHRFNTLTSNDLNGINLAPGAVTGDVGSEAKSLLPATPTKDVRMLPGQMWMAYRKTTEKDCLSRDQHFCIEAFHVCDTLPMPVSM